MLAAIWGVESNFGQNMGQRPLVQSLSTLACLGERASYFRGELMATLKIIDRGDVPADKLNGSWAGAFGQTQFMPSTFLRLAVDFEGDGRRDIVRRLVQDKGARDGFGPTRGLILKRPSPAGAWRHAAGYA